MPEPPNPSLTSSIHSRPANKVIRPDDFAPWVRAVTVEDSHILWLPVTCYPMRHDEKFWILAFLRRFSTLLESKGKLRQEVFLQYATATADYVDPFRRYVQRCQILLGLSRSPGEDLTGIPEMEDVQRQIEAEKRFDLGRWTSDYSFWFQNKGAAEQEELFLGAGGLTSIYLAADPATAPPPLPFTPKLRAAMPVFKRFDVDATVAGTMALNDKFLLKSKEIFGDGIEFEMDSIGFILPRFDSGHLIWASPEDRATWFQLFDVYFRESPKDKGVLLAFQKDMTGLLRETLADLQKERMVYPLAIPARGSHA